MLSVVEALNIVRQQTTVLPAQVQPLTPAALGLVVAEEVVSDIDMPPYDKAMMDGYAVRCIDLPKGHGSLEIIEEITAGRVPQRALQPGQSARIMTGAPTPQGADAVIMRELTELLDDQHVRIADPSLTPGRNILTRGREMCRNDIVLSAGAILRPQEMGLLATVGRTSVRAIPRPQVGVLSTGDEIVAADQAPGPGQIRNSNGPMLLSLVQRAGGTPASLGIVADQMDRLRSAITQGLQNSILLLSGGVSAGRLDLVPGVLEEIGVRGHFHKVSMKPGKPVFFGTFETSDSKVHLVFGLPGNPVSAFACFELFVRPAIRKMAGHADPGPRLVTAKITEEFAYKTDRPTYHPAQLDCITDGWRVRPCAWFGSPDLRSLTQANALVLFPVGEHVHRPGSSFDVLCLD